MGGWVGGDGGGGGVIGRNHGQNRLSPDNELFNLAVACFGSLTISTMSE